MRNTIIRSILLSILLVHIACNPGKIQLNFAEEIEYFGEEFIEHFPREIDPRFSLTFSQDIFNGHPCVWLKARLSESEKDSLLIYLAQNSLATYAAEDTCVLVLDGHLKGNNRYKFDKRNFRTRRLENKSVICGVELLPIPKFYGIVLEDDNSPTGLYGYDFYVLRAEKGEFYDQSMLTNSAFAPEGWDHGISKGVAINESTNSVIYWSDVW